MKIAIIGGGWVGCHLGYKLKNEHDITIYEKNNSLFEETSLKNQNRLHLGYHYARNYKTRMLCIDTFESFLNDYEFLTKKITNNIYCVPNFKSLIDFQTYKKIFNDFEFNEIKHPFKNVEGCINTDERYIDFNLTKTFFTNQLSNFFVKEKITPSKIKILQNEFDLVINATNNQIKYNNDDTSFFELTISLIYENKYESEFDALTMVDGNLFSIYPYYDNKFTVTDVIHTPIKKFKTINSLEKFKKKISQSLVNEKIEKIEKKIINYYPEFKKNFKYFDYFISIKSKINSESDERYPVINVNKNLINCFTGKIQGIYIIEDFIKNKLKNYES